MVTLRRMVALAAALTMAASAAGCSSRTQAGPAAVTPSQAAAEYRAEEPHLQLAPGWVWPNAVAYPTAGPDGAGMVYQQGFGTTQADHLWYCSWENRLLQPTLTPAQIDTAREQISEVRTTHMYLRDIVGIDRAAFDQTLNEALSGDTTRLRRDVRLNCPKPR